MGLTPIGAGMALPDANPGIQAGAAATAASASASTSREHEREHGQGWLQRVLGSVRGQFQQQGRC